MTQSTKCGGHKWLPHPAFRIEICTNCPAVRGDEEQFQAFQADQAEAHGQVVADRFWWTGD